MTAGLVGAMFYAAFGSFHCQECGKIPRSEFSAADRTSMLLGSLALVIGAILLVIVVIWLVVVLD